jgi:protein tyrosine phosphatase (PTP) superfamily phosphohydrolase (DUF442 family)
LWRGAAPSSAGLKALANSGVKTIIDLRLDPEKSRKEARQVSNLGMRYVHIPLGYLSPSKDSLRKFFSTLKESQNSLTYVHCVRGADRTGTLVAMYRVLVQKWSFLPAYKEMRAHHFKPWLFTMKERVETCAERPVADKKLENLVANCSVLADNENFAELQPEPSSRP